jgi:hypothetical protein
MLSSRLSLAGAAAACLALPLAASASAVADDDGDGDGGRERVPQVLVRGLDAPRGLAVSHDGDVYVAQAGRGGDGPCIPGPEGGQVCLGATGKISRMEVASDGEAHLDDVVTGLASLAAADGSQAIGPSDVALDGHGRLHATIGLGADPTLVARLTASPVAGQLASVNRVRGDALHEYADIAGFEARSNPDHGPLDTNPNALTTSGRRTVVVDAGGNDLLAVRRDGTISTLAVFPAEAPVPNPMAPGQTIAPDAVPDSVVRGPDGAFYVGQLTGFPFVPGTATVWRVEPGEDPTVYADGFTNIIDVAFTDDGDLLVLEIAHHGLASNDPAGALYRVSGDNPADRALLTDRLVHPGGLAVDGDTVYISNDTTTAGAGQILELALR